MRSIVLAIVALAACAGDEETDVSIEALTTHQSADLIKEAARWWGITNPVVIAGVANHEVPGMNQCNPNFCIGPATSECPNGIVIGGGDGTCAAGGVGIFQLDRGTYWNTIDSYLAEGIDIRFTQGNAEAGIRHIVDDLRRCWATPIPLNASDAEVVAWINTAIPDGRPEFEVFLSCMAKHYNGCGPSCSNHANVRAQYRAGVQSLINAYGWAYWYPPPPSGDCGSPHAVIGAIRAKWESFGDCGWGAPLIPESDACCGGRYQTFDNGVAIYWTEALGAHEVHGAIRDHWTSQGWEWGWLGFPITDEYQYDGTTNNMPGWVAESEFEHGWVSYCFDTGEIFQWTK